MKNILTILILYISFNISAQPVDCTGAIVPNGSENTFNHNTPTIGNMYYAFGTITASNYTQNTTTNYISNTKVSLSNGFTAITSGTDTFSALVGTCIEGTLHDPIFETNLNSSFTVFPNPSKDYITLGWEGNLVSKISIASVEGKIIFISDNLLGKNEINLNIEQFPTGIYTVLIENKGIGRKIIKL
jgi:hypothetical protein